MKELLQLPEKFEIHKKSFSKESFLTKARLTEKEKKLITDLVASMQLVYDVCFHDKSEIILMDVELRYKLNQSTDIEVARAISAALPHDCIFLIKNKEYARIVLFSKKGNSADVFRSVICNQASTNVFFINDPGIDELMAVATIALQLSNEQNTAKNAIDICIGKIGELKKEFGALSKYEQKKSKADKKIQMEIEYGMDGECDPEAEGIADSVYDYDDEWLVKVLTEEAVCDCAYTLYLEFQSRVDELDWLLVYAKCCAKALTEIYKGYEVKSDFYRKLGAEFQRGRIVAPEDYLEDTALDLLREMLDEEYTWSFDVEECEKECSTFQ